MPLHTGPFIYDTININDFIRTFSFGYEETRIAGIMTRWEGGNF